MKILLGIGNDMRGDDGIGVYIARKFRKDGWVAMDCSTVPENYIGKVIRYKPEKVVIVDAAEMGLEAGEIRKIPKDKMGMASFSTHSLPLSIFINHVEKNCRAEIVVIGIQPKNMYGEMSEEVRKAGEKLMEYLTHEKIDEIEELK